MRKYCDLNQIIKPHNFLIKKQNKKTDNSLCCSRKPLILKIISNKASVPISFRNKNCVPAYFFPIFGIFPRKTFNSLRKWTWIFELVLVLFLLRTVQFLISTIIFNKYFLIFKIKWYIPNLYCGGCAYINQIFQAVIIIVITQKKRYHIMTKLKIYVQIILQLVTCFYLGSHFEIHNQVG